MINEHRLRGQLDALQGWPYPNYGCHTGMRSTYERDKAEYIAGWQEVTFYLLNGDDIPLDD